MFKITDRLTTPILLIKTEPVKVNSRVVIKATEKTENAWAVWKSYGGTEKSHGGNPSLKITTNVSEYEDTATVQIRYTPFLKQNDFVENLLTNELYRVITVPDDINQLHQFLVFKVKKESVVFDG